MLEIIRFILFALALLSGLAIQVTALFGVNRFRYSINRIHAAGMGDTLGLMLIAVSAVLYIGFDSMVLKILLIVFFFWLTSPVSGHLLGRLVSETDEHFHAEAELWKH